MDTVWISIGTREIRYSAEYAAEYRDEDTGKFCLESFLRDHIDELSDEAFGLVDGVLDEITEWSEEYNTTDDDAGDAYSCLPSESWPNCWPRLRDYIAENYDVTDDELDRLQGYDWQWEMRPGHIFSGNPADGCAIDYYPVGEIEEEVEISHLEDRTGLTAGMIAHILQNQNNHCMRMFRTDSDSFYIYINTDAVWLAVVTDESIEDVLADE